MVDHGLIDFEQKTINVEGIREHCGIPPGNAMNCVVENVAHERTAYVETPVGAVTWVQETQFVTGESYVAHTTRLQPGGGSQAFPDIHRLNERRASSETLPIAQLDGQTYDFRDFQQVNKPLTPEQHQAMTADYAQRRAAIGTVATEQVNEQRARGRGAEGSIQNTRVQRRHAWKYEKLSSQHEAGVAQEQDAPEQAKEHGYER